MCIRDRSTWGRLRANFDCCCLTLDSLKTSIVLLVVDVIFAFYVITHYFVGLSAVIVGAYGIIALLSIAILLQFYDQLVMVQLCVFFRYCLYISLALYFGYNYIHSLLDDKSFDYQKELQEAYKNVFEHVNRNFFVFSLFNLPLCLLFQRASYALDRKYSLFVPAMNPMGNSAPPMGTYRPPMIPDAVITLPHKSDQRRKSMDTENAVEMGDKPGSYSPLDETEQEERDRKGSRNSRKQFFNQKKLHVFSLFSQFLFK
eukprot:TRINITY_DN6829_c0_g1_i4.p1 TRINITY_DN6829_c0_g1~~TRINITY_DN6829_c0_g1_i4.p1  ORF type:complete len:280 (+),score=70.21 TRINITY_DN6829_c0_g1_i4:69-842(+)